MDFLPDVTRIRDTEKTLLRRRTASVFALVTAIGLAALEVSYAIVTGSSKFVSAAYDFIATGRFDSGLNRAQLWGLLVLFLSLSLYFALRWTGVMLTESKAPFRYTFWIEPFTWIANTPADRCTLEGRDRFELLHHDLTQRLHARIRRFAILADTAEAKADAAEEKSGVDTRRTAHITIGGTVALREERDKTWVVQITPTIRVGPPGTPMTLAAPVAYRVSKEGEEGTVTTLNANQYNQIVERVYSRIGTEIYAQIDADVRRKIELFPTPSLRAIALYHEAEDFARSNTVDGYDRAITLYRDAMRAFDVLRLERLTRWFVRLPLFRRHEVRYHHHWARIVTGYAKCLVYKREMSALAGREPTPIFDLADILPPVLDNLAALHKIFTGRKTANDNALAHTALTFPADRWPRLLLLRPSVDLFQQQKQILFETHLADALASVYLSRIEHAMEAMQRAEAVAPDWLSDHPLYLVARGLLTDDLHQQMTLYQRAVDLSPTFQMARWLLAQTLNTEFRRRNEITEARAQHVLDGFEAVLALNRGNIAALAARGYLWWLIGKSAEAIRELEEGREIKAIAQQTFTGTINYRLARIAAERREYNRAYALYTEAVAADRVLATHLAVTVSGLGSDDYETVSSRIFERYERYRTDVEADAAKVASKARDVSPQTVNAVRAFVLNDYGLACLGYFREHGHHEALERAVEAFRSATAANPEDPAPWFNGEYALSMNFDYAEADRFLLRQQRLAPEWNVGAMTAARARFGRSIAAIDAAESAWTDFRKKHTSLQRELLELKSECEELEAKLRVPAWTTVSPNPEDVERLIAARKRSRDIEEWELPLADQNIRDAMDEAMGRLESFTTDFEQIVISLARDSRLGPLRDPNKPLTAWLEEIARIPWKTLSETDVVTLVAIADLTATATATLRPEYVRPAIRLASVLYERQPSNFEVLRLAGAIDVERAKPPLEIAEAKRFERLRKACDKGWTEMVGHWLQKYPRSFLSLWWDLSLPEHRRSEHLQTLKETYFDGKEDHFHDLVGNVFYRLTTLEWKERCTRAAEEYAQAIALKPDNSSYHYHRANALTGLAEDGIANAIFRDVLQRWPEGVHYRRRFAQVLNLSGNVRFRNDNYVDALESYQEATEIDDQNADSYGAMALTYLWLGGSDDSYADQAVPWLEKAAERSPESWSDTLMVVKKRQQARGVYGSAPELRYRLEHKPVIIETTPELWPLLNPLDELDRELTALRERFRFRWKLDLPAIAPTYDPSLVSGTYRLALDGHVRILRSMFPEWCFCPVAPETILDYVHADVRPAPDRGPDASWIAKDDAGKVRNAGFEVLGPLELIARDLDDVITAHLPLFLRWTEVIPRLKEQSWPPAIAQMADDPVRSWRFTEVIRALAAERVPLMDFNRICREFLKSPDDPIDALVERMRLLVRRHLPGRSSEFTPVRLADALVRDLKQSLRNAGSFEMLALDRAECTKIRDAIQKVVEDVSRPALVVGEPSIRMHVRRLVAEWNPALPVLAEAELP